MGEGGKARAADDFRVRKQGPDHRLDGGGAEQHCLVAAARVEQAIREQVPALAVGGQLGLVECDESEIRADRHGLCRAQQPASVRRLDPLFPGDQRNPLRPLDLADPVIDLARQQPQRKADRAGRMGAEPFDGEVGLAGVGRAKHRLDAGLLCAGHRRSYLALAGPACKARAKDFPNGR